MLTRLPLYRNATLAGVTGTFSQPDSFLAVLEEVGKYNVHLNILERLWAVRTHRKLATSEIHDGLTLNRRHGTPGCRTMSWPPAS